MGKVKDGSEVYPSTHFLLEERNSGMEADRNWLLEAQIRALLNRAERKLGEENRTALLSTVLSAWLSKLGLGLRIRILLDMSCYQPVCNPH